MPNEEVLGPRKTMFVLVIVVGCFAVLWPKILSPLILGGSREQLKPNAFDREAGCCEVIFDTEVAILEILNEVCSSIAHTDGKLSPYAVADCRRTVNETCGVDIAAFLKHTDNVGKTAKAALDTMKASNSSCLKEHFGVPTLSLSIHPAMNSWIFKDTLKQERSPIRAGAASHPAMRERGRAIPAAGASPRPPTPLPPHHRVPYNNPLSGYFEIDIKPPPIPGMRPPLGSPGGPVPAPKSSMGFVMPIYTICIIVFFVYTLSKLIFRRHPVPYDPVAPNPQFRRRVFRDDSRSTPDRLVVTAISGLVAEVQQQMEASYAQNQQPQELQENNTRPYTNGTIIHSGPVQIVASEYRDPSKEISPEIQKEIPEPKELSPESLPEPEVVEKETLPEEEVAPVDTTPEKALTSEEQEPTPERFTPEPNEITPEREIIPEKEKDTTRETEGVSAPDIEKETTPEIETAPGTDDEEVGVKVEEIEEEESPENDPTEELIKLTEKIEQKTDTLAKLTEGFLKEEQESIRSLETDIERKRSELLKEALNESSSEKESEDGDQENSSVKVVGMEMTAHTADGGQWPRAAPPPLTPLPPPRPPHEAEDVKSIFLETEIPQQSRVLVADFAQANKQKSSKHSPMVVSGKMTLSLIQDSPRDTPERDPESTLDDYTTASGVTQPAEKEDDLSEEEDEIEIEEIEEIEEEEEEDDEEPEQEKEK